MKVPRTVQIGPSRFDILIDEAEINKVACEAGGDGREGSYDGQRQKILIRPGLGEDRTAETLTHEVLHALMEMTGIANDVESNLEESMVTRLAPVVLDLLRRNPALVHFLCG